MLKIKDICEWKFSLFCPNILSNFPIRWTKKPIKTHMHMPLRIHWKLRQMRWRRIIENTIRSSLEISIFKNLVKWSNHWPAHNLIPLQPNEKLQRSIFVGNCLSYNFYFKTFFLFLLLFELFAKKPLCPESGLMSNGVKKFFFTIFNYFTLWVK